MALLVLPFGSACAVGAKANVPFVRLAKIELKKSAVGKNKKYRRVGLPCRQTVAWLMIFSPVTLIFVCQFNGYRVGPYACSLRLRIGDGREFNEFSVHNQSSIKN